MNIQSSIRRRIVIVSGLLLACAALAQAHTKLEKSAPAAGATVTAAPRQIQLWFNEKIDLAVSKIEVTSAAGKVELAKPKTTDGKSLTAGVTGTIADGTYTVAWQAAGDDGHVAKGTFKFTVKAAH